uniref:Uncharacterized protein n=1 Tax=Arundo donax TaxID=35708 RepID=A0A0A9B6A0_ARUDO
MPRIVDKTAVAECGERDLSIPIAIPEQESFICANLSMIMAGITSNNEQMHASRNLIIFKASSLEPLLKEHPFLSCKIIA